MKDIKWEGLVVLAIFVVGLAVLGIAAAVKYDLGPFAPVSTPTPTITRHSIATPTPLASIVRLLDYGRFTRPIPELHIEEPAGALIIYVEQGAGVANYVAAIEALDPVVALVVSPGDRWIYYFDTLSNGTLFVIFRCVTNQFYLPAGERSCESSVVQPGRVLISFLYDNGFESSQP